MRIVGAHAKWLKLFHVLFSSLWVGGAISLVLMGFLLGASTGAELYGISMAKKFVDDFIVIPGAFGCLITGVLYSTGTDWGWFKHRWITVKWIINAYGVVFGTIWLGPWLNSLPDIAHANGIAALGDPVYVNNASMLNLWGTFQATTIVAALMISVLRPWQKDKRNRHTA
jgi:hypothetical protein